MHNVDELVARHTWRLKAVTTEIQASIETTGDDIIDAVTVVEPLRSAEDVAAGFNADFERVDNVLGRMRGRKSELGLVRPLTYAVENISKTMEYLEFFKFCQESQETFRATLKKDPRMVKSISTALSLLVKKKERVPLEIWDTLCRKFPNVDAAAFLGAPDPLVVIEGDISEVLQFCFTNVMSVAVKNPSLLVRCLQAMQVLSHHGAGMYSPEQTDRLKTWIKACTVGRIAQALAIATEQSDEGGGGDGDGREEGDDGDPPALPSAHARVKQLSLLTNDLLILHEHVRPCFPPQFDVYHYCVELYCETFSSVLLALDSKGDADETSADLAEWNQPDLGVVMHAINWLRKVVNILRRQDKAAFDSDGATYCSKLVHFLNAVLVEKHTANIKEQMDNFVTQVAQKLWEDEAEDRIVLDSKAGVVHTKEPQDVMFFLHHQIDICRQHGMRKMDFYRVITACFHELPRYGNIQFEYLLDNWQARMRFARSLETPGRAGKRRTKGLLEPRRLRSISSGGAGNEVTISTLCAYVNDNEKLTDECLELVDELEEEEDAGEDVSEGETKQTTKQFEDMETARDNMIVLFTKYAKDVSEQIGKRLFNEIVESWAEEESVALLSMLFQEDTRGAGQAAGALGNGGDDAKQRQLFPVSAHVCTGCEDLLENVWEWLPNKYLRSLVVVALIDTIVDAYLAQIQSSTKPFLASAATLKDVLDSDVGQYTECFQAEIAERNVEGPALKNRDDVKVRFKRLASLAAFFDLRKKLGDTQTADDALEKWFASIKQSFSSNDIAFLTIFVNRCFVNVLQKDSQLKKRVEQEIGGLWE